ncbi:acyl carrier protein [Kitasatospora sp. NBC_01560]|uniref:acyl carrier protein n=1 Tax=Kitasatospora sp. NBC_01560 TaxID=2975965 RepID=UPI00386E6081
MSTNEIREIIAQAIGIVTRDPWPVENWDEESALRSLGISSLMLFQLVSELERLGGFRFDDADIDSANFRTLGQVAGLLSRYPVESPAR